MADTEIGSYLGIKEARLISGPLFVAMTKKPEFLTVEVPNLINTF